MIWIGIDPGTPLTIVVLSQDGATILDLFDGERVATFEKKAGRKTLAAENSPELITACLRPYAALNTQAVIERVSARPEQGISSSTRFVGSMYLSWGVCAGLGVRYHRPTPSVWKKAMDLSPDKERSRAMALRQWPQHADLFRLKGHHDRAEAALLALYGLRRWGQDSSTSNTVAASTAPIAV